MRLPRSFALLSLLAITASGQIPGGSSAREIPREVEKVNPRVGQLIERANDHFQKGKLDLADNKKERARDEFDKAVDEILMSGLDVRANQRLQTFYLELVEKIYREEVALLPPIPASTRIKNPLTLAELDLPKLEPTRPDMQLLKSCQNELFDKANIRGLRLRMTAADVKAVVSTLRLPIANSVGAAEVTLNPPFGVTAMNGVSGMTLNFLDSKLYRITA